MKKAPRALPFYGAGFPPFNGGPGGASIESTNRPGLCLAGFLTREIATDAGADIETWIEVKPIRLTSIIESPTSSRSPCLSRNRSGINPPARAVREIIATIYPFDVYNSGAGVGFTWWSYDNSQIVE